MLIKINKKKVYVKENVTVAEALNRGGFNPVIYIVKMDGKIIPEDEKLKDGDVLELIKVSSGG